MKLLFSSIVILFSNSVQADFCDAGLNAFSQTVYKKVRNDCVRCHDGRRPDVPPFAAADVKRSYERLLNYMNFSKIEDSLLVIRAGNGHCGDEVCEFDSGEEMKALAQSWWESGEKQCFRNGRYFTNEVSIPQNLPDESIGYVPVIFELGAINPELDDLTIQVDIQNYLKNADGSYAAYRFKSPRLVGVSAASVKIKNIKLLLNGKYDPIYNAFTTIERDVILRATVDRTQWASPVLSAQTMIVLKDSLSSAKLSVSFDEVTLKNATPSCQKANRFSQNYLVTVQELRCNQCHNGDSNSYGTQVLNFNQTSNESCEAATALLFPEAFITSPLLKIPIQSYGTHPQLNESQRAQYVKAFKAWLLE